MSQGDNSAEFNINLDPVHLDKNTPRVKYNIKSRTLSLLLNRETETKSTLELRPLALEESSVLASEKRDKKSYLNNPVKIKVLENLGKSQISDFSIENPLITSPTISEEGSQTLSIKRGLGYITNNIEHISLSPKIGFKNGILINYQKIISYNFNKSSTNPKEKALVLESTVSPVSKENEVSSRAIFSYNKEVRDTYELLFYFFKSIYCLISKPVFLHSADKVIIQLFYYLNIPHRMTYKFFSLRYIKSFEKKWLKKKSQASSIKKNNSLYKNSNTQRFNQSPHYHNGKLFIKWRVLKTISRIRDKSNIVINLLLNMRKFNISKVFHRKFYLICQILSRKFNKPVEFQLIRLHNPFHDSNILVNLLSLNIRNKHKNAKGAFLSFYRKGKIKVVKDPSLETINLIPAYLSGLYLKIAGRLMREAIIPKVTTRIFEKGASSIGKVNYLDIATITKKNRKGAYTLTIKTGQNFFMPIYDKKKNFLNSKVKKS